MRKLAALRKKGPTPVMRGLICWLDARDGKGTETIWVDRSGNSNDAILKNFDFNTNSGWTGSGLKFDGVDDSATSNLNLTQNINNFSVSICFMDTIENQSHYLGYLGFGESQNSALSLQRRFNTLRVLPYINEEVIPISAILNKKVILDVICKNGFVSVYKDGAVIKKDVKLTGTDLNKLCIGTSYVNWIADYKDYESYSIKIYNRALVDIEIQQNYEYEKDIDRTAPMLLPVLQEEKTYGIGLANQLTEEQLKSFRLSNDKTKFVAGLRYCKGLEVEEHTYSEVLEVMEASEWKPKEIEV